ncbi:MAG: helix-turn-helix domain-containing protein [Ilumatobacteraceae bacterium]
MATSVNRPLGRDEIHEAVLDAAERLFAERGASHVTMRTIAAEADVTYSLVNRHFGTKEALVEKVLARFEERWLGRLAGDATYEGALDILFGDSADSGPAIRLMAWTLLSNDETAIADAQRRHLTIDRLPTLRDSEDGIDARLDAAAAIAFAFGWRFFAPILRDALHLDDVEGSDLHEAMRTRMQQLARLSDPLIGGG